MRSAKSFFDLSLLRNELSRAWPLWAFYTTVWIFLLPVTFYSDLSHGGYGVESAHQALELCIGGGMLTVFFFSILFAMQFFSYLTSSRATGGFHALPLRRETLFITTYLAGLFCQIVSIALAVLLCTLIAAPYGCIAYLAPLQAFLVPALETVLFYSFAVLCMVMTGQSLAAPVFYVIGSVLAIGMEVLVTAFAGNFLFGYTQGDLHLMFASPLFALGRWVGTSGIYSLNEAAMISECIGYRVDNLLLLVFYAFIGLAIAAAALFIYRKRKSEMTGSTVAILWAVPIFKYGVAFCTAMAFGQISYYLFFGQYQSSGRYSLAGTIVCMLLSGLLGYYIAEALVKKSFHVLKSGRRGALVVTLVLVLLGITMTFDLTGYENRVPDVSEIESAYYSFSGMTSVNTSDGETLALLTDAHRAIVENKDTLLDRSTRYYNEDKGRTFHLSISYTLKNGTLLSRYYTVTLLKDELSDPTSATSRVNALYLCADSTASRIFRFSSHAGSDLRFLEGQLSAYLENGSSNDYSLSAAQVQAIYDVLWEDVEHFNEDGSNIFSLQEYTQSGDLFYDLTLYAEQTVSDGSTELCDLYVAISDSTPRAKALIDDLLPSLPLIGTDESIVAEPDEKDEVIYIEGTTAVTGVSHG